MFLKLDPINILIVVTTIMNMGYGLIVYSRNQKSSTNKTFLALTLAVSAWGLTMFLYRSAPTPDLALLMARLLYVAAALIPISFLYFVYAFPSDTYRFRAWQRFLLPIPAVAILIVAVHPQLLIDSVQFILFRENFIVFRPAFHLLYGAYIVGYFLWGYLVLLRRYVGATGILKTQILFIFLGTFIATSIGVTTNLALLLIGNFTFNWMGQIGTIAMIAFISYAILKHHLFDIKVIATEILVFALCLTLFTQIFLSDDLQSQIIASSIFTVATLIGILLIRSVIREVKAREQIEVLARELRGANERLKELDTQKTQFLSIASHDLRAPLTGIRNFIALLIDGTYGSLPAAAQEGARQIFDRATAMASSVDTYLNVSRIEQGRMKYDFTDADLSKLVSDTVAIFKPIAEKKGLSFALNGGKLPLPVTADVPKIQEVLNNLVDNSIKYTPTGSISVSVEPRGAAARVTIQDTGVGMTQETIGKLFKLFSTAADSRKVNTSSTGLGLYISKAHVEAHKGKVWAESDGEGKGSRFIVELPLKK